MDFRDSPGEAAFRTEVRAWLAEHLTGEFAALGAVGGPADEAGWDVRLEWEKVLGRDRWVGLSWPIEYGGRHADLAQQIVFNEEYARANAPAGDAHIVYRLRIAAVPDLVFLRGQLIELLVQNQERGFRSRAEPTLPPAFSSVRAPVNNLRGSRLWLRRNFSVAHVSSLSSYQAAVAQASACDQT